MREQIAIIEEKTPGVVVVLNITKKVKQFIPFDKFEKRVRWGIYELVNACLLPIK